MNSTDAQNLIFQIKQLTQTGINLQKQINVLQGLQKYSVQNQQDSQICNPQYDIVFLQEKNISRRIDMINEIDCQFDYKNPYIYQFCFDGHTGIIFCGVQKSQITFEGQVIQLFIPSNISAANFPKKKIKCKKELILMDGFDVHDIEISGDLIFISSGSHNLEVSGDSIFIGQKCSNISIRESSGINIGNNTQNISITKGKDITIGDQCGTNDSQIIIKENCKNIQIGNNCSVNDSQIKISQNCYNIQIGDQSPVSQSNIVIQQNCKNIQIGVRSVSNDSSLIIGQDSGRIFMQEEPSDIPNIIISDQFCSGNNMVNIGKSCATEQNSKISLQGELVEEEIIMIKPSIQNLVIQEE